MEFKDHFSKQAADYAKFRPRYPQALFDYLGTVAPGRELAWDCATGNGQAAIPLASVFNRVIATDASDKQIANAEAHERVEYQVAPAENSGLTSGSVDLVMVAQALHWFNLERFYAEVRRVLKPRGIIAASAYLHLQITPAIDAIVQRYYHDIVGPYWPPERKLIERFDEFHFPFPQIEHPAFDLSLEWDCKQLMGYLWTWSATQRFRAANDQNPLDAVRDELSVAWGNPQQARTVSWPLKVFVGLNT